jgi:hypothetical protein
MKFGINAQVIIALLGALYILMVCGEKYRIEYAEGEPVAVEKVEKQAIPAPDMVAVKAKKPNATKAPIVAVKAEKTDVIEEEEEATIEGQAMIEEEGMSTGAIVGITAVSIVALIAIMITMRRLRR